MPPEPRMAPPGAMPSQITSGARC